MSGATDCECSEDYGPCSDHSEVLAQREGASTRTADELLAVFIGDVSDILGRRITERDASDVADAYWTVTDNAGGWIDHDHSPVVIGTDVEATSMDVLGEALRDAATYGAEGALSDVGAVVWWDDGYVISRTIGGPLS